MLNRRTPTVECRVPIINHDERRRKDVVDNKHDLFL